MRAVTSRATLAVRGSRGMAAGGRAAFNWQDPLLLDEQLTDEEQLIKVRTCCVFWMYHI